MNPFRNVISQRTDHAGGKARPQQRQHQGPVGAKHNIEAIVVIGVTHHGIPRLQASGSRTTRICYQIEALATLAECRAELRLCHVSFPVQPCQSAEGGVFPAVCEFPA